MKFLLLATPREGVRFTPEMVVAMLQAANKSTRDRLEDKSMDCIYAFPGGGGIAIVNVTDHEDLVRRMAEYPAGDLFRWEIKPLANYEASTEQVIRRMNLYIEYANRRKKI